MKYLAFHYNKFEYPTIAFLTCILQLSVVMTVECVLIFYLQYNFTVLALVMNYVALGSIAQFDDYFASAYNYLNPIYIDVEDGYPIEFFRKKKLCITDETYSEIDERLKN